MTHLTRLCALLSVAFLLVTALGPSPTQAQDAFVTTWETTSVDESITIPTESSNVDYDFEIDWGDGTTETVTGTDPDPSHTYSNAGTHQVEITGTFPRIFLDAGFRGDGDEDNAKKLQSIDQWGSNEWENMKRSFVGASNLTYNATDSPDLSGVTSLRRMFKDASSFNGDVGGWDVSGVKDMVGMFQNANSFNQDLDSWDVSNVNNMRGMFENASSFNGDISDWDVSTVTDMSVMFGGAESFNQEIGEWSVGQVRKMESMFIGASNFNQDIGGWNVSNVRRMNSMFKNAVSFDQNIGEWDVSTVTSMSGMFNGATDFNGDISSWDVSNVTEMGFMFKGAESFNQDISGWAVSNVTDMSNMFSFAQSFNQEIGSWNVSAVTDMRGMFRDTPFNQDIGGWDVYNVASMSSMFNGASAFNQDIGSWDVSSVEDASFMFKEADSFNQDISEWDVSNITDMSGMFSQANSFNQNIGSWDVSSVEDMSFMFSKAYSFNQDVGSWETGNVTNMRAMFQFATSFDQDLGGWDVSSIEKNEFNDTSGMGAMLNEVALSATNYDRTLTGWAEQDLNKDIVLDANSVEYCNAGPSRAHLTMAFNWTINGDGQQVGCPETLESFDSKQFDGDDALSFESIPMEIGFSGADLGWVTVSRYGDAPENVECIGESNVSQYRLVVAGGGLSFDSAELYFPVTDYEGIDQPGDVTVYARSQPGKGSFDALQTDFDDNGTPDDISDDTLSATTGSFSEFVFASDTNELPVELASFDGTATESSAHLTWQTASETNNAGFEVQRQKEKGWTQVGYVDSKAQGGTTTETKSYSFTAEDLAVGTHQFRLKQVDLDGSSTLIDPVTVDIQMQKAVKLTAPAPNPASSNATLSFAVKEQAGTTITLYNTLGQQVATVYEGTPQAGEEQRAQVDVSGLSSGTYFLRLEVQDETATQRISVVR